MKLATLRDDSPDGRLVVVSADSCHMAPCEAYPTLLSALYDWAAAEPTLRAAAGALDAGTLPGIQPCAMDRLSAPLPRAWQWLDGSAFPSHADLMQKAFDLPPLESDRPLMYQGLSHCFLGPLDNVPFPSEADGIDFEAELGVITDAVPMGVSAREALAHVKLLVLINDWSLRAIAPIEMKTGFGWIQAKPACSMAPVAVTPDAFGRFWSNGRLEARLQVRRNGETFGDVPSIEMAFGFDELIAHAARTRSLCAGTIVGSGTVSSSRYAEVGSCCIAERRAIETNDGGTARTPFLAFGETVELSATVGAAANPFGTTRQRIAKWCADPKEHLL
jgi:fumarylacetoacetate (FAA) hydrolase